MDEYITRDEFIEAVKDIPMWGSVAAMFADGIPAADVAPVVHGRWSDAGFGELPKHAPYGWACSVCGGISFNNEYIYCPNCGAIMDGGAGHEAG